MSKETNPAFLEFEEGLRTLSEDSFRIGHYLRSPMDVRRYLGSLGYGREYSRKLVWKYRCPCPRRNENREYTPIPKGLVDMFIRQRRRSVKKVTRLQLEAHRLVAEKGMTFQATADLMGSCKSTVNDRVQAVRKWNASYLPH